MSDELYQAIYDLLEDELWKVRVHPCDDRSRDVRAQQLPIEIKRLYDAFLKEVQNV